MKKWNSIFKEKKLKEDWTTKWIDNAAKMISETTIMIYNYSHSERDVKSAFGEIIQKVIKNLSNFKVEGIESVQNYFKSIKF